MSDDDEIAKAFADTMMHGRGFTRITSEGIKHVPLSEIEKPVTPEYKVNAALTIIERFAGIDGAHHKQWVIDQVVRVLVDDYAAWVIEHKAGEDGPDTYDWDEGIPP